MKLINFSFLKKKDQRKEKSLLLKEKDTIHISIFKRPDTEIIITCKDNKLEIFPREAWFANKKKDNLD